MSIQTLATQDLAFHSTPLTPLAYKKFTPIPIQPKYASTQP